MERVPSEVLQALRTEPAPAMGAVGFNAGAPIGPEGPRGLGAGWLCSRAPTFEGNCQQENHQFGGSSTNDTAMWDRLGSTSCFQFRFPANLQTKESPPTERHTHVYVLEQRWRFLLSFSWGLFEKTRGLRLFSGICSTFLFGIGHSKPQWRSAQSPCNSFGRIPTD